MDFEVERIGHIGHSPGGDQATDADRLLDNSVACPRERTGDGLAVGSIILLVQSLYRP